MALFFDIMLGLVYRMESPKYGGSFPDWVVAFTIGASHQTGPLDTVILQV